MSNVGAGNKKEMITQNHNKAYQVKNKMTIMFDSDDKADCKDEKRYRY